MNIEILKKSSQEENIDEEIINERTGVKEKSKSALAKLRESKFSQKIIKVGAAATFLAGLSGPLQAETYLNDKEAEKKEILENSMDPKPESYDAYQKIKNIPRAEQNREKRMANPVNAFLEDMQYSENISLIKEEQGMSADYVEKLNDLLKQEGQLIKLEKDSPEYLQALKLVEEKREN